MWAEEETGLSRGAVSATEVYSQLQAPRPPPPGALWSKNGPSLKSLDAGWLEKGMASGERSFCH